MRSSRSTRRRCASSCALAAIIEACARRGIRAIDRLARPGAGRGPARRSPGSCSDAGLALSGYCRGGFFPAADAAGLARRAGRQPPRRRRGQDAGRALPGAGGGLAAGRARRQAGAHGHRRSPAPRCTTASPPRWSTRAASACRSPSSRCTPCRPPSAPASTRWSRRSTSATRSIPAAAARWAWRSTSITCGGTRSSRGRSRAPAATGCSPTTCATGWCRRATCSTTAA